MEVRRERHVIEARWRCRELACAVGFGMYDLAAIETAVSELASNLLRHAGQGILAVHALWERSPEPVGIELTATNLASAWPVPASQQRAGLGVGLAGVQRLMDSCHIEQQGGTISRVTACKWLPGRRPLQHEEPLREVQVGPPFQVEVATRPAWGQGGRIRPQPAACADGYWVHEHGGRLVAVLLDVLGRGERAAPVLRLARQTLARGIDLPPAQLVEDLDGALRGTRGACAAAVAVEPGGARIRWVGVGSVRLRLWHGPELRPVYLPVVPGVVGYNLPPLVTRELVVDSPAVLALASDGLWEEGLERLPMSAGAVLDRFARPEDDATLLVVRWKRPA